METYHARRSLADVVVTDHPQSFALVGVCDSVETAIIFVHGFRGSPDQTWSQFELIDRFSNEQFWTRSDLFFYGYDSVNTPLLFSAAKFLKFLQSVFPAPPRSLFFRARPESMLFLADTPGARIRTNASAYSRLILVAHSEGAVVVRRSLCDLGVEFEEEINLAIDPNYKKFEVTDLGGAVPLTASTKTDLLRTEVRSEAEEKIEKSTAQVKSVAAGLIVKPQFMGLSAELKLFAPAHCGALVTGNLAVLIQFLRTLFETYLNKSIAGAELVGKAAVISSLKSETEELANKYPFLPAFRANILWGEHDDVVDKQKFRFDRFEVVSGRNHSSICKPNPNYYKPLAFLQDQQHAGRATV